MGYLFAWASLFGASLITGERGHMNIPVVVEKLPPAGRRFFSIFGGDRRHGLLRRHPDLWRIPDHLSWPWARWTSSLGVAVGVFYVAMPVCGVLNVLYTFLNIRDICGGRKEAA